MGIAIDLVVDTDVFSCANSTPGIYKSDKGSVLIKPDANMTNKGNIGSQSEYVMITDVDTGKTIIKHCSDVKGTYKFVCDLDDAVLSLNNNW